tara:strand:+ start:35 stop:421 length:387 start_codon:yes stop_codon:yes gene_type:complete
MTKTFNKYEFTPTEWATLRKLIEQTTTNPDGEPVTSFVDCAVVELGFLPITPAVIKDMEVVTPAVLSEKWAVDILFYAEVPKQFDAFAVYPPPMGIHTFSGDDSLYLKAYCEKFPDSPYCIIPTNEKL